MKANRYKIQVCEGLMDHLHGGGYNIDEIFVPELGLYINCKAAFLDSPERMFGVLGPKVEIELDVAWSGHATALAGALRIKDDLLPVIQKQLGLIKGDEDA